MWMSRPGAVPAHRRQGAAVRAEVAEAPAPSLASRFILWAYAVSGFAALGYEVVWARILAIFTLDAVFSYAIMLSTFLFGLAVGGWLGSWWTQRRKRPVSLAHFVNLQVAVGLTALLTLFVFARLPALSLEAVFGAYSVANVMYYEFLLGFLSLFLPTMLLGILFPIAVSLYTQESPHALGRRVGRFYAFNTAGAVLGALFVSFVLIPVAGLQATAAILAVINLLIGLVGARRSFASGAASGHCAGHHAGLPAARSLLSGLSRRAIGTHGLLCGRRGDHRGRIRGARAEL
jgi:spermidine synthase